MRNLLANWTRRAWLATWLQDRRRARQQAAPPTPNAPVMTGSSFTYNVTQLNWADISIYWTFVHGTFPLASIELWQSLNGGGYTLLVTGPSNGAGYYYALACDINGGTFDFKTRYKNGATLGPFSNVLRVDISAV